MMLASWNSLALPTENFSRPFGMISCSLVNATSEPQNEIEPMIAAISEPTTIGEAGLHRGTP